MTAKWNKDPVILDLISHFQKNPWIYKAFLFGSRVRGTENDRADYDIAVEYDQKHKSDWTRFYLNYKDSAPTLLGIDLIDLNTSPSKLKSEILNTGVIIYELKKN